MTGVPEQFIGLFDDAATFPPGLAPVETAVTEHVARRGNRFVSAVGPAVLALKDLPEARRVARTLDLAGGPVNVSAVTPVGALDEALHAVDGIGPELCMVAIELKVDQAERDAWTEQVQAAAAVEGMPIFVELTAEQIADGALEALAGTELRLKYRTGGIEAHLFPTPEQLGDVLVRATDAAVPFKLTAGLHEAVRYTDTVTGITHHGFLNIALATQAARARRPVGQVVALLAETDGAVLAQACATSDGRWRESFRSFGTCSVSEPADSLHRLGLFEPCVRDHRRPSAPEHRGTHQQSGEPS